MNTIQVKIGDIDLTVPASAAARGFLEMVLPDRAEVASVSGRIELPLADVDMPAIGERMEGGIYAGLSIADNKPVRLVLLPGDEELNWKAALAWAAKQGGVLPSRFDALVLFTNLKKEFKETWYWTAAPYAGYESYAWVQSFDGGGQDGTRKSLDYRARAVRRLPI